MRITAILIAFACLLTTGCVSQTGTVWQVDRWEQTVTIGDDVYRVTEDTRFYGADGLRISLGEVPSPANPQIGVRSLARAQVDFRAHQRDGRLYLDTLWVRQN